MPDFSKLNKELNWQLRCDCGATMPLPSCAPVLAKDMIDDLKELLDPVSMREISQKTYTGTEMPMVGGVALPQKWLIEHQPHELWMHCREANWEGRVKKRDPVVRNRPGVILGPDGKAARLSGASALTILPGGKS